MNLTEVSVERLKEAAGFFRQLAGCIAPPQEGRNAIAAACIESEIQRREWEDRAENAFIAEHGLDPAEVRAAKERAFARHVFGFRLPPADPADV